MISVIFDDGVDRRRGRAGGWPSGWRESRASCPPGATPELTPDAAGDRPDLLVHRRGRRPRPGPAARDPGLVRPPAARLGAGRGRGLERRRVPDRVPGRRPTPTGCGVFGVTLKDVVEAVATSNAASGGHVVHKGNAEYVVRGVGWLGASPTPGDESFDPGAPSATWRTSSCRAPAAGTIRLAEVADGRDRARLPPRRPREGRQRGHRRRGLDGPRREPARGHAPDQGQDPRAAGRPAARRPDRAVLRPHAADRGGDRHRHRHGRRGDDLGLAVRARDPAARADLARHRRHAAAGRAVVVPDHGGLAAARASSTSRPTPCRWRASRSRSACWSIRRS